MADEPILRVRGGQNRRVVVVPAPLESLPPALPWNRWFGCDPATFLRDLLELIEQRLDLIAAKRPDHELRHQRPTA